MFVNTRDTTSFCVPVEQGMMKMYRDFTVRVAVLLSLCVFQRLFLTTHTQGDREM